MATDRPGASGPAPGGSKRSGERQADGYFACVRDDGGEAERQGKIAGGRRCQVDREVEDLDPGQTSPSQDEWTDLPKTDTRRRTPSETTDTHPSQALQGRSAPRHRLASLGLPRRGPRPSPAHRTTPSSPAGNRPGNGPATRSDVELTTPIDHISLRTGRQANAKLPSRPATSEPREAESPVTPAATAL